jgi:hypothetical protein
MKSSEHFMAIEEHIYPHMSFLTAIGKQAEVIRVIEPYLSSTAREPLPEPPRLHPLSWRLVDY